MVKISSETENEIIVLLKKKESLRKIAKTLEVGHSTVLRVRKRHNLEPNVNAKGRNSLLTDRDARRMERLIITGECKTPKPASLKIGKHVSEWTTRRALRRIGLVSAVKQKKPALSPKNIKARLEFCKQYKNWTIEDWKKVIWSDETKINRYQSDGKEYYWHRLYETIKKHHVKPTVKHGGGNIMVWGCFNWWRTGPLVKIDGIMKKDDYLNILKANLPEFIDLSAYPEEELVFQQDRDPKHTAKVVQNWLSIQNFKVLKWPAQSPDLNPIENLWAILKKRLSIYEKVPKNAHDLWLRVQSEWNDIQKPHIEKLVESMPKRIREVKKNKGLWTKY